MRLQDVRENREIDGWLSRRLRDSRNTVNRPKRRKKPDVAKLSKQVHESEREEFLQTTRRVILDPAMMWTLGPKQLARMYGQLGVATAAAKKLQSKKSTFHVSGVARILIENGSDYIVYHPRTRVYMVVESMAEGMGLIDSTYTRLWSNVCDDNGVRLGQVYPEATFLKKEASGQDTTQGTYPVVPDCLPGPPTGSSGGIPFEPREGDTIDADGIYHPVSEPANAFTLIFHPIKTQIKSTKYVNPFKVSFPASDADYRRVARRNDEMRNM